MKKTSIVLSVIFLAVLFVSSCSPGKNLVIEKRHYGKGYYVHTNGKRDVKANTKIEEAAAINENQSLVSIIAETNSGKEEVARMETTPVLSEKPVAKTNNNISTKKVGAKQIVAGEQNSSLKSRDAVQPVEKKKRPSASSGEVETILLVILCILLPPLAVYLSEGITTNFWIDVVLTLLLWLPGIVFAFYVCFA